MAELGLRERKKQRTRTAIADAAIAMFLESGFDAVSCADVAARAEVSKPTLFKYFPAKEDLVLHRIADHEGEAAAVVRERAAGEDPLAALRRHYLAALAARDPITGLNDSPEAQGLHRLIGGTPSLSARLLGFAERRAEALADALVEAGAPAGIPTRIAAHQVVTALRVLAEENVRQVADGHSPDELHPEAVAAAECAFDMLRTGLDGICGASGS
ncbi:transcriptional regulator, TetR family [Saccharopolyspora shandongensis]|uniref:Transcriptional regulator, TetR family n=1 Tax=Saccharopolyspora shandongensis TaxID=418495 RepID=A0A1H3F180_9PSEU|nr:TetR family transcriptional regulator [Saccharopolyspora shandongensis]SDX84751.1 transcriptional regulator, TetR family [Saccharopolyspora shandongensis]